MQWSHFVCAITTIIERFSMEVTVALLTLWNCFICKRKHFNPRIKFVPENTHSKQKNRFSRRIIELMFQHSKVTTNFKQLV